ncbi:MAG: SusC/RagA family TonB-linked outer membrane protein [Prevotellaceae bacterium]|jgi:TonB-linked SusC/RagA family outer membrane protein|nr:SusC/RagA family TonB-linked outer membrane protein [Prevotellaceae bacterium]
MTNHNDKMRINGAAFAGFISRLRTTVVAALLITAAFEVSAQFNVSGTVFDKGDNQGISTVNILVIPVDKSIAKTVEITNSDGKFAFSIPGEATLRFTCVGYDTVSYKITKSVADLKLYMNEIAYAMEGTVIVGYQEKSLALNTASVTVINTKDLVITPVSGVMELLQGRVPGLNIQMNNGLPGMQGTYTVRGISDISISGGELIPSQPLFVVDGIPVDENEEFDSQGLVAGSGVSPLAFVPVEDIDNIQVLRDAAATSMYGSRGAYGVILINTRKGSSPKPKISYSAHFKINTPPRLRDVVVGAAERNARIMEILQFDTSYYHAQYLINSNPYLSDSLNAYYNNNTDWQDVFYRITYNQTHNLSFDGGDKKFRYKVNSGMYKEEGIIKNTNFNRYTLRTSMAYNPTEVFGIEAGVNAGIALNSSGSGSILSQTGIASGANTTSLLPPPSLYASSNDILGVLSVDDNKQTINYNSFVNLKYKLPWKMTLNGTFGYNYETEEQEKITPGMLLKNEGRIEGYSRNSYSVYARFNTGYSIDLWIVRLGLNVGTEINSKNSTSNSVTLSGLANDYILGPVGYRPGISGGSANASMSETTVRFMFNPSFDFLGFKKLAEKLNTPKYVFTPGINPETSSSYGSKTKWTLNPLLAGRWNFQLEPFMDKLKFLTSGSLRASWGKVTKYKATIYDIWGSYLLDQGTYGGATYIPINYSKLPNVNLSPITSTTWNLGIELGFLRKHSLVVEAYYRQIDNQLSDSDIANHNAFSNLRNTDISLVNYGLEFSAGLRPLPLQSEFNLSINFTASINRDVTARLPNDARQITVNNGEVVNRIGSNTMANNLYVYKGVYATDADVPVDPATGRRLRIGGNTTDMAYFRAGDPIWADVNGDYIIDAKDKMVIGNSQARATGGMNLNFSYKNFALSANTVFVMRRDIINAALADRFATYSDPLSQKALVPISAYNFWTPVNTNAEYPNPFDFTRSRVMNPFRRDQTLFMEDGSYFKIGNASLTYTVPKELTGRLRINTVRFTASVNNIYTFSNYSGINPENVTSLGYDNSGGYPNARNWALGVNINF